MPKLDYARPTDKRPGPAPRWDRRGLLLSLGAGELLVVVVAYAGRSWADVLGQLFIDGWMLLLWLIAAVGWGAAALAPLRRVDPEAQPAVLRGVTAVAAGLGLMSLATLGIGLAGLLSRAVAVALVAGGIVTGGAVACRRWGAALRSDVGTPLREWLAGPAGWHWTWLAVLPLLGISLVAAMVPPGMLWTPDEPHGYDVVAYHFQVPREWYEARRIVPLQHNVFSYFPFAVEMHYLLAMHLGGGPWKGMYLAQLMHVAYVALSVIAVYGVASSLTGVTAAAVTAALIAAGVPWLTLLAPIGFNEGGLLLYGVLAVGWALRATDAPRASSVARFALAGAMAGFACGVKLTAVPMVLAAVPVAVVAAHPRSVARAAAYLVTAAVVFSPWAIRNLGWTGNPVFPEAARLLGQAHFTDTQVERWERAHSPRSNQKSVRARAGAAAGEVLLNWRFGYAPLLLGVVAIGVGARDSRKRVLYVLLALLALFWLALTHLQGRFFVLAVPVVATIVALTEWGRLQAAVAALAAGSALSSWALVHRPFAERMFGSQPLVEVLGVEDLSNLHPPQIRNLPQGSTLSLIGEAKTFVYQHPMRVLRYRTVFDVDTAAGPDVVSMWRGGTTRPQNEWELIHPMELRRFADTYWAIPQPPPELRDVQDLVVVPPAR